MTISLYVVGFTTSDFAMIDILTMFGAQIAKTTRILLF